MANRTITWKTQRLDLFGPSPSTKWSNFSWGTGTWGMKSAGSAGSPCMIFKFYKVWSKSNSISISAPAASIGKTVNKKWTGTNRISSTFIVSDIEQYDANGYHYVFPGTVTNAASEFFPNYSSSPAASTTYTSNVVSATIWT